MRKVGGSMTYDITAKLDLFSDYTTLYSSSEPAHETMSNFLDNVNIKQLNERDRDILDALIQFTEIMAAITRLKPNKSPGNNGLPGDFYKKKLRTNSERFCKWFFRSA